MQRLLTDSSSSNSVGSGRVTNRRVSAETASQLVIYTESMRLQTQTQSQGQTQAQSSHTQSSQSGQRNCSKCGAAQTQDSTSRIFDLEYFILLEDWLSTQSFNQGDV